MTTFKTQLLTILTATFLVSCAFSNSQNDEEDYNGSNMTSVENSESSQGKKLKNVKVYDDTNGLVMLHFPIPKDWNYDGTKNAEFMLTAPNNITVAQAKPQTFAYSNDAFSLQTLYQMQSQDFEIAPVTSLNDILKTHVIPSAESQGYTLNKDYELPGVLKFLKRYESGMLKTSMESEFFIRGTDWKDGKGNKSFIVFVQTVMYKHGFIYWTLESTELEAPEAYFDEAKEAFIYALENRQINMAWQHTKNGELFNLSFEVLTTTKVNSFQELAEKSLLSKYNISYNYSLLLIDKNKTPKFFKNNFVTFTPEFNDQMKNNYKVAIKDSVLLDKSYLTLLPQPFTVDLAKVYSQLFDGNSFLNEKASKEVFTKQAKEHKIIHIGTHAESNNVSPEFSRLIFAKNLDDVENPDNNSLYTYEIYNQNLASNLAILTACETGKPSFKPGEGMISLAHAFNYAGSESILTSLWKIDEQSSAQILDNFYKHLQNNKPKDEALRLAKIDYIKASKGRVLAPQYWAGLVLIGDTSPVVFQSSNILYWLIGIALILIMAILLRRKLFLRPHTN